METSTRSFSTEMSVACRYSSSRCAEADSAEATETSASAGDRFQLHCLMIPVP